MEWVLVINNNGDGEKIHRFSAQTRTEAVGKSECFIGKKCAEMEHSPFSNKGTAAKAILFRELFQWK